MKKWLKKWLGISELEKVVSSEELKTLLRYSQAEIESTKLLFEKLAVCGEITMFPDYVCSYNTCYNVEKDGERAVFHKYYNKVGYDVYYEIQKDYVVLTGKVAEELYKIVDKRFTYKKS